MALNTEVEEKLLESLKEAGLEKPKGTTIYLVNGIKLVGRILEHDDVSVLFSMDKVGAPPQQLVYKHAISTMA